MAYCSIQMVKDLLPKNFTIGDTTVTSDTLQKPSADTVSTQQAEGLMNQASSYVDSRLRTLYQCPLKRVVFLEESLLTTLKNGGDMIEVPDNTRYTVGSMIRVQDSQGSNLFTVKAIPQGVENVTKVQLERTVTRNYASATVKLIEYPDPIPKMCAQLTVSYMFDQQFVAQQSPDVSNYGRSLRTQAMNSLDKILAGIVRLDGQEHVGRRFSRMSLRDTWASRADLQPGQEKES